MESTNTALLTFVAYTVAVFLLAALSNRVAKGKEFVGEYFLGSRNFGVWAFALTFAATNASGGTFMGFPALIYSHGWTLALWIASFMMVPLVSMAMMGKRLNQIARKSGALTIPEVLRERFGSPNVGIVSTSLLIFFMFFYLVAQFKAGGKILSTLLSSEPLFQSAVAGAAGVTQSIPWINQAEPDYLVCLIVFSVAVIVYVVYGGFRAVVWTDVMQGIVMFIGVILLLGLALWQVGGMSQATEKMAAMTTPEHGTALITIDSVQDTDRVIPNRTWVEDEGTVVRLAELAVIPAGETSSGEVKVLKITTPHEVDSLKQSINDESLGLANLKTNPYAQGADKPGVYLFNPGPDAGSLSGYLPITLAISFFFFWPFGASGQPSNMVRLLSFKDTRTLRYAVVTVSVYYAVIYLTLVVTFCCARVLMPGMEVDPDRTMPDFATKLTDNAGVPWLAGLLVAAPFAAVMSSVDSFLLVVSSAVVRDLYQGYINRDASERTMKRLSYGVTIAVGVLAVLAALNPPTYLQDLIVFATGGLAACFLVPMLLALYWPRMTAAAAIAGMLGGTSMHLLLTAVGYLLYAKFQPYKLLGLDPFLWDVAISLLITSVVAKFSSLPPERLVKKFFEASGGEQS